MNLFESLIGESEDGLDVGKKYITTSYKYTKLKTFQIFTYSISFIIKLLLIGSLILAGVIFLAIASAVAIGDYYRNPSLGYLIIGLLLFFISLLFFFFRNKIDKKIIRKIASLFFDSNK